MSTRRARIKAVTSLPPRRKNGDHADNKSKLAINKDHNEPPKSPRTPRSLAKVDTNSIKSPSSNRESPLKSPKKDDIIKISHPAGKIITLKGSDRVPVITVTSTSRPVFVSPRARSSPRRKLAPSPVRTPKGSENTPKLISEKETLSIIEHNGPGQEQNTDTSDLKENNDKIISDTRSDIPYDYNVPSVPESIPEDAMDGIIPLVPTSSAPKPIDLLKNAIISEKAEVLFDPIVPLPSPSKVRPKVRPVPRLAPLRRNSIQGSASESEDESRRALLSASNTSAQQRQRHDSQTSQSTVNSLSNRETNRIRNDSVCSSISQATGALHRTTSPVKEKQQVSRRQEISRRMAAIRRRRETIKRDNLTMYDLIFYNPDSNPLVPDKDELAAKEANEREANSKALEETPKEDDSPATDAAPVPQIKLGPNGEIVLDEQSLVVNQTNSNRKVSAVVREGAWGGGGSSYRRTARTADWSDAETVRFYRALAAIGTDFTLMGPLFPERTRRELKIKFKKEEKCNGAQVDKALRSRVEWDAARLQDEFTKEREVSARRARESREQLIKEKQEHNQRKITAKELRVRQSRCTKALGSSALPDNFKPNHSDVISADEIIRRASEDRQKLKRRRKKSVTIPPPAHPPSLINAPHNANSQFATLTLINPPASKSRRNSATENVLTIMDQKTVKPAPMPDLNPPSAVPGSLVVLTVNDPNSPSTKMLQTYIAHAEGVLTPVALPQTLLNSVVGYMQKGPSMGNLSARSSPLLNSPRSVASHESRTSVTPSVVQMNPSPMKRQRHSSYTITPL